MAKTKSLWTYTAGIRTTEAEIGGMRYAFPIGWIFYNGRPAFTVTEPRGAETYDKTRAIVALLNKAKVKIDKKDGLLSLLGEKSDIHTWE